MLAAGSHFIGKIQPGSRVYITNVRNKKLFLVGGFTVREVVDARASGKPAGATRDAPEYLLAEPGTSAELRVRSVPTSLVKELRFVNNGSKDGEVMVDEDNAVDKQAMRAVRELRPFSAAALEGLLTGAAETEREKDWTEDELRAAVVAYLQMLALAQSGKSIVKKQYYRDLGASYDRSEGAFEYRMQNISYVLSLLGREWIPGLPPAKNVGTNVAAQLEHLINDVEGKLSPSRVAEVVEVAKVRRTKQDRPGGNKAPAKSTASVTTYVRDPQVKAWVLNRAKDTCEGCSNPAPFTDTSGFPFLEVHHVRHLADGGTDTTTNAIAVCPNCHRRLHYSADAREFRGSLFGSNSPTSTVIAPRSTSLQHLT